MANYKYLKMKVITMTLILSACFLLICCTAEQESKRLKVENEQVEINTREGDLPDKLACNQDKVDNGECLTDNNKVQIKFNSLEISDAIIEDKTYGVASASAFLRARGEIGATQNVGVVNGELYVYERAGVGVSVNVGAELSSKVTTDYRVVYPKQDYYFVIVDVTIANLNYQRKYEDSIEEQNTLYFYYKEFQLYDTDDYSYKANTPRSDADKIMPANNYILKGDRFRGKLIYEIPKNSDIIEFLLKGGSITGNRDIGTLKLDISSIYSENKKNFVSLNEEISDLEGNVEITNTESKNELEKLKDELINTPNEIEITIIQNQDGTFTCPNDSIVTDFTDC